MAGTHPGASSPLSSLAGTGADLDSIERLCTRVEQLKFQTAAMCALVAAGESETAADLAYVGYELAADAVALLSVLSAVADTPGSQPSASRHERVAARRT